MICQKMYWISLSLNKSLESWVTNWWNTRQSEIFLNDSQEKSILEKFIELDELALDEYIIQGPFKPLINVLSDKSFGLSYLNRYMYQILSSKYVLLIRLEAETTINILN
ncbi:hypothetical protein LguiA_013049 [Lonicera macranthoides]